jgi:hypothetical protein
LCAECYHFLRHPTQDCAHLLEIGGVGIGILGERQPKHADAHSLQAISRETIEQYRVVANGSGDRPERIARWPLRHRAEAAHQLQRRLQCHQIAVRGRAANRARRVFADADRAEIGGDGNAAPERR